MSFRSLSVRYSPTQSSRSSAAWTTSSSTSRSTASRPLRPHTTEIQRIASAIHREQHDKDLAVVVVVRQSSLGDVERRCRVSGLKFWKNQNKSLLLFTTPESLQYSLLEVQADARRRRLTLLVSDKIEELAEPFHVPARIKTLKILRTAVSPPSEKRRPANSDDGSSDGSSDADDGLLLNGTSTFDNVRFNDWLLRHRGDHHLHLGESVRIRVDDMDDFLSVWNSSYTSGSSSASSTTSTLVLNEEQQAAVREHLARMDGLPTDGSWWETWKGPVAGVLGALAGAAQLATQVTASAKGIYLAVAIPSAAVQAGLAAAGVSAAAAPAAAPAVVVGVAVGLAVYFIPWGSVFRYLREKVLPSLLSVAKQAKDAIVHVFERLLSWLKSLLQGSEGENKEDGESHIGFNMRFPGVLTN